MSDFQKFPKIPRLYRDCVITEKIDGTNGCIYIATPEEVAVGLSPILAGSRNRWLTLEQDNFGFFRWVSENAEDLMLLGPGYHYGEWWGAGIQRSYGLKKKKFSLFNVKRWGDPMDRPLCCDVVPTLYEGPYGDDFVEFWLEQLKLNGSYAAPGFMDPEGIIVYMTAARQLFKVTLDGDGHKG